MADYGLLRSVLQIWRTRAGTGRPILSYGLCGASSNAPASPLLLAVVIMLGWTTGPALADNPSAASVLPALKGEHRFAPMTGRPGAYIVYDQRGRRIGILEPRTGTKDQLRFVPDPKK